MLAIHRAVEVHASTIGPLEVPTLSGLTATRPLGLDDLVCECHRAIGVKIENDCCHGLFRRAPAFDSESRPCLPVSRCKAAGVPLCFSCSVIRFAVANACRA